MKKNQIKNALAQRANSINTAKAAVATKIAAAEEAAKKPVVAETHLVLRKIDSSTRSSKLHEIIRDAVARTDKKNAYENKVARKSDGEIKKFSHDLTCSVIEELNKFRIGKTSSLDKTINDVLKEIGVKVGSLNNKVGNFAILKYNDAQYRVSYDNGEILLKRFTPNEFVEIVHSDNAKTIESSLVFAMNGAIGAKVAKNNRKAMVECLKHRVQEINHAKEELNKLKVEYTLDEELSSETIGTMKYNGASYTIKYVGFGKPMIVLDVHR